MICWRYPMDTGMYGKLMTFAFRIFLFSVVWSSSAQAVQQPSTQFVKSAFQFGVVRGNSASEPIGVIGRYIDFLDWCVQQEFDLDSGDIAAIEKELNRASEVNEIVGYRYPSGVVAADQPQIRDKEVLKQFNSAYAELLQKFRKQHDGAESLWSTNFKAELRELVAKFEKLDQEQLLANGLPVSSTAQHQWIVQSAGAMDGQVELPIKNMYFAYFMGRHGLCGLADHARKSQEFADRALLDAFGDFDSFTKHAEQIRSQYEEQRQGQIAALISELLESLPDKFLSRLENITGYDSESIARHYVLREPDYLVRQLRQEFDEIRHDAPFAREQHAAIGTWLRQAMGADSQLSPQALPYQNPIQSRVAPSIFATESSHRFEEIPAAALRRIAGVTGNRRRRLVLNELTNWPVNAKVIELQVENSGFELTRSQFAELQEIDSAWHEEASAASQLDDYFAANNAWWEKTRDVLLPEQGQVLTTYYLLRAGPTLFTQRSWLREDLDLSAEAAKQLDRQAQIVAERIENETARWSRALLTAALGADPERNRGDLAEALGLEKEWVIDTLVANANVHRLRNWLTHRPVYSMQMGE